MTVEELSGRMHDDINSECERPLQVWRHKCVVANHTRACGVRYFRHAFEIRNDHHWICRGLDKYHAGIVFDCGFDVSDLGSINKIELNPVVRQYPREQTKSAAVSIIRNNHVLAGFY